MTHATFVIERTYDAAPARVFAAWATPRPSALVRRADDWERGGYELDFRVGGRERAAAARRTARSTRYDARYQDIVPNERIIYTYDMHLDDKRISVSLATVELKPAGQGHAPHLHRAGRLPRRLRRPRPREQG